MKKKGFIVLLLIAAMILSIGLSGCTLVKLNEERQAQRVLATVTYTVQPNETAKKVLDELGVTDYTVSAEITRWELIYQTNLVYSNYASYLSYGYDWWFDYTYEGLITTKYRSLRAIEYLLNNRTEEQLKTMYMYCKKDDYTAVYGKKLSCEGVLTMSEWYDAIAKGNSEWESNLDRLTVDEDNETRSTRISDANNKISEYYEDGYFVSDVFVVKKVDLEENETKGKSFVDLDEGEGLKIFNDAGEKFVDGLYETDFVLSGTTEDEPSSKNLDYMQVYAAIEMKKGDETVYVVRPVDDDKITVANVADFIAKNVVTRNMTVTVSGRKAAKVTEDNDTGYTTEDFISDPVEFRAAFARNALKESEEETEYLKEEINLGEGKTFSFRYASQKDWEDFIAIYNADAEEGSKIDKTSEKYNAVYDEKGVYDGLMALYATPIDPMYEGSDKNVKDAYRQLRNLLTSMNFGYNESRPEQGSEGYASYPYYNGLYNWFNFRFFSDNVLEATQYVIGAKTEAVDAAQTEVSYLTKVKADKVNYDSISYAEQRSKFFSDTDCIDGVYYVPMKALEEKYEISADDKAYAALFENGAPKQSMIDAHYVVEEDGKYYMPYIVANDDGTYTINAFFINAVLFSFGNDEKINDAIAVSDGKVIAIDGYKDLPVEQQIGYLKTLAEMMTTTEQKDSSFDALQEKVTKIEELYEVSEDGALVTKAITAIIDEIASLTGDHDEIVEAFGEYMKKYNDDGGAMLDPGHLIVSGEIGNDKWGVTENVVETALDLYYGMIAAGIDPNAATENLFAESVNYEGLRYMMITFAPYYHVTIHTAQIDGETYYYLDPETELNLEGNTQNKTVSDSLLSTKKDTAYSNWEDEATKDMIEAATVKDQKSYDKLIKEVTEKN